MTEPSAPDMPVAMRSPLRNARAVLIGVGKYRLGPNNDLSGPVSDAESMAKLLIEMGMPAGNIDLLITGQGDRRTGATCPGANRIEGVNGDRIYQYLNTDLRNLRGDALVVYWSGHGYDYSGHQWVLLPEADQQNWQALDLTGVILPALSGAEYDFPEQFVFVDACRTTFDGPPGGHALLGRSFAEVAPLSGNRQHTMLAAPIGSATANLPGENTGAFSRALRAALRAQPRWPWQVEELAAAIERDTDLPPVLLTWRNARGGRDHQREIGQPQPSRNQVLAVAEQIRRRARPDSVVIRQAFYDTINHAVHQSVKPALGWTTDTRLVSAVAQLLESHPVFGVGYVLDFFERIAALCVNRAGDPALPPATAQADLERAETIRRLCDDLAAADTALKEQLALSRELVALLDPELDSRTHLLVWIERDGDIEPDASPESQRFKVRAWQYIDGLYGDQPPPGPYVSADFLCRPDGTLSADELLEWVTGHCPTPAEPGRLVVELMADDLRIPEGLLTGLGVPVVVRPARPASRPDAWFSRWRAVAAVGERPFQAVRYVAGGLPADHPGLIIYCDERPIPEMFPALIEANVPVAVWGRQGGQVNGAAFTGELSFLTPTEFFRERQQDLFPADVVLMWHNPHWFPEQNGLQWRKGATP